MSRTTKDLPYWLWHHTRLGLPAPPAPHRGPWTHPDAPDGYPWSNPAEWEAWQARWATDPAIRGYKDRRKSSAADRRLAEGRYRAYVRDRLRHGDWDAIEPPCHLTGWRDWAW